MNLEDFEELLKKHDWYYDYSDDHRIWQRGRDMADVIRMARQSLTEQGFDIEAQELYNRYCPFR